jgi:hypothetical protein
MAKKKWSDLTPRQQRAVKVGGVIEAVMTAAALRDLASRPAEEVRGSKTAWMLAFFVQPFGPITYFAVGRR